MVECNDLDDDKNLWLFWMRMRTFETHPAVLVFINTNR